MKLGNFVTLKRGHDLPEQTRRLGHVPILGSFGVTGYHDTAKAKGPGVTVGRSGASFGTVSYSAVDYWPLNTALYVTDFHGNDERFTYYLLSSLDFARYNSGSAQPSLNRNYIHPMPVRVPEKREQCAIAHILGTLDDKIELNRRMNETLEEMARAFFKSWFVDFDPVQAKAEGRQPSGMDAETASLFPDSFEDSSKGQIPRGWRIGKVHEAATINRAVLNPHDFLSEVFDHYSIPAFDEGRIPTAETGREIKSQKFIVSPDSVLLSRLNPQFPRVWLPNVSDTRRSVCSTEYLVVLALDGFTREYLYFLLSSSSFFDEYRTLVTGTSGSHQRVKADYVLNMEALIPRPASVQALTKIVTPMLSNAQVNIDQSLTLIAIRDTLLPELLSGEIRVKGAEKLLNDEL